MNGVMQHVVTWLYVLLAHAPCTLLFCILLLFVTYSYYYFCYRWPV